MTGIVDQAWHVACWAHDGQVDKAGRPYLTAHVLDVLDRLPPGSGPRARAVALLHDVVEDSAWTLQDLAGWMFPRAVIDAVDAITHRPHEPRDAYYARVKANPLALTVKLADIASNTDPVRMAALDEATRHRLTAKYAHALEVLS